MASLGLARRAADFKIPLGAEIDAVAEDGTTAKALAMQKYQIDLEEMKAELSEQGD